jgi:hypothetical protein
VLVGLALFAGGGSSYGPLVWLGTLAIAAAGALLALGCLGRVPWPGLDRAGLAFVVLFALLVAWSGASIWWSVAPDLSWEYFNRGVVYLAFLVVGLFVGAAVVGELRAVAGGLTLLLAAVLVWALAGKVVPNLFPDGARIARLRDPIEYWNGLALVAAMAMPLGLWHAVRREHARAIRVGGVVLLYVAGVALLLTYSRGGTLVALVLLGVSLMLFPQRVEVVSALALSLPAAAVVAAWAFTEPGVADDLQSYDVRLRDGIQFGIVLVVVAAALAVATHELLEREDRWRPKIRWELPGRWLAVGAAVVLVLGVLVASGGRPVGWAQDGWDEFTNPTSTAGSGPERIGNLNLNSRWTWWKEAWTIFTDHPVVGAGAGSFQLARRPIRANTTVTLEPHNLPLQSLSDTGLVGFLLFVGSATAAAFAVVRRIRRLVEAEAAAACALAVAVLAYPLHAMIDYDWDFVALTAPVLALLGVLVVPGPGRAPPTRWLWAAGAIVAVPAFVYSLGAPWLADRKVEDAFAAVERNEPREGLDAAEDARSLNPLSIDPLLASALAEEELGDERAALKLYVKAVDLQPKNWRAWYELGRFELRIGLRELAIRHLQRARQLDKLGSANDLLKTLGL